jgi:protein O-GlcNAc transferase
VGAIPVEASPAKRHGYVTFGSFNTVAKISDSVIGAWADVLRRTQHSRLLLKSRGLQDAAICERFGARLVAGGVNLERVTFLGLAGTVEQHLRAYGEMDIALDTFPYNGTTTTCEALWMGVPVVTLRGTTHVGRVGASLCRAIEADDFVASSLDEYVNIATTLAANPEALSARRNCQRTLMQRSQLCDVDGFARDLEQTYRNVWRVWVREQNNSGSTVC